MLGLPGTGGGKRRDGDGGVQERDQGAGVGVPEMEAEAEADGEGAGTLMFPTGAVTGVVGLVMDGGSGFSSRLELSQPTRAQARTAPAAINT
jgi:hypothetical protein